MKKNSDHMLRFECDYMRLWTNQGDIHTQHDTRLTLMCFESTVSRQTRTHTHTQQCMHGVCALLRCQRLTISHDDIWRKWHYTLEHKQARLPADIMAAIFDVFFHQIAQTHTQTPKHMHQPNYISTTTNTQRTNYTRPTPCIRLCRPFWFCSHTFLCK